MRRAEHSAVGPRSAGARARPTPVACALIALLAIACTRAPEKVPPPNVVLVSIDSLRADHVHAYGYERETTPTLDAMASGGVRFETALSPTSWTLPAHITLLTGKHPEQHQVIKSKRALAKRAVTLAEALHDAGYATAGFVSGPYLQDVHGYAQGFDVYDTDVISSEPEQSRKDVTSPELVRRATAWLEDWRQTTPNKPFFLFVHFYDVHFDYVPPPPYDRMFDSEAPEAVGGNDAYDHILPGMESRDLERVLALYDGEIRWTDENLGQLLEVLENFSGAEDTLVVVTSDHGEEFLDHQWRGHSKTLYDEAIHVPLVMKYPRRIPAGQVVDDQVRLSDVAPTILGLAGVHHPKFGSGSKGPHRERDLTPWITGGSPLEPFPRLLAFGELRRSTTQGLVSVRSPEEKYIEAIADPNTYWHFRLSDDPTEKDLVSDPPRARALASERKAWLADLPGRELGFWTRVELKKSHVDRLRALGYLE